MYLLHCSKGLDHSLRIVLQEHSQKIPPYAILSHRWRDGEVSFQDCHSIPDIATDAIITKKPGYRKLKGSCSQALQDGYSYVWVDTCCIDKSSSAELSEAINSMYNWYERSQRCYVYLDDACSSEDPRAEGSRFRKSEWFNRGWTLQELIAPTHVAFFDAKWKKIDNKASLANLIAQITRVDEAILRDGMYAHETSIAQRMSWAGGRKTSKDEDRAYSLLGLFGVHMPTIYGEGSRAFRRLQLEIMRVSADHSIFAWQGSAMSAGVLAESPDQFLPPTHHPVDYDEYVQAFNISQPKPDFTVTNFGLYIQLPITSVPRNPGYYYGFLACSTSKENSIESGDEPEWAVIYLHCKPGSKTRRFARTTFQGRWVGNERVLHQEFDSNPLYLLLYEDIWPLSWLQLPRELVLPSTLSSTAIFDVERTITLILAKSHQNIEIVDACPGDYFTSRNEILLETSPEVWAMKMESGRATFPPVENGQVFIASRIKYGSKTATGRHLATLIVSNGMDGGRMLIVVAVLHGGWQIFLSEVKKDLNASACRKRLLYRPSAKTRQGLSQSSAFSHFTGLGIPFGYEHSSVSLGRYFVTVERQIGLGSSSLAYRITVGLRQLLHIYNDVNSYRADIIVFNSNLDSGQDSSQDSGQDSSQDSDSL
jgi:hypothetical protein